MTLLGKVKHILLDDDTDTEYDEEIQDLIDAAFLDLGVAGVDNLDETDPLIIRAVCTYCQMHFRNPMNYDRLKASYDEQKAQLSMCSDYVDREDVGVYGILYPEDGTDEEIEDGE